MLEVKEITKKFNIGTVDEVTLFDKFSISFQNGEFVSIVGSNGSGKTTLLNIICGNENVQGGDILFEGQNITSLPVYKRAPYIGRVFQDPQKSTCSHLTIIENMALADNKGKAFNLGRAVNKKNLDRYRTLLESCEMGLENRMNVPVGSLSGGQRQALALLLATMTDIKLLILDEHTAALDPKTAETVMILTDKLIRKSDITALMVTHNLRYAVEYGDRLVMFDKGNTVLDINGSAKQETQVQDLLTLFNTISIECGN
jgi:putative ABC transport system ATP-binding protein